MKSFVYFVISICRDAVVFWLLFFIILWMILTFLADVFKLVMYSQPSESVFC